MAHRVLIYRLVISLVGVIFSPVILGDNSNSSLIEVVPDASQECAECTPIIAVKNANGFDAYTIEIDDAQSASDAYAFLKRYVANNGALDEIVLDRQSASSQASIAVIADPQDRGIELYRSVDPTLLSRLGVTAEKAAELTESNLTRLRTDLGSETSTVLLEVNIPASVPSTSVEDKGGLSLVNETGANNQASGDHSPLEQLRQQWSHRARLVMTLVVASSSTVATSSALFLSMGGADSIHQSIGVILTGIMAGTWAAAFQWYAEQYPRWLIDKNFFGMSGKAIERGKLAWITTKRASLGIAYGLLYRIAMHAIGAVENPGLINDASAIAEGTLAMLAGGHFWNMAFANMVQQKGRSLPQSMSKVMSIPFLSLFLQTSADVALALRNVEMGTESRFVTGTIFASGMVLWVYQVTDTKALIEKVKAGAKKLAKTSCGIVRTSYSKLVLGKKGESENK